MTPATPTRHQKVASRCVTPDTEKKGVAIPRLLGGAAVPTIPCLVVDDTALETRSQINGTKYDTVPFEDSSIDNGNYVLEVFHSWCHDLGATSCHSMVPSDENVLTELRWDSCPLSTPCDDDFVLSKSPCLCCCLSRTFIEVSPTIVTTPSDGKIIESNETAIAQLCQKKPPVKKNSKTKKLLDIGVHDENSELASKTIAAVVKGSRKTKPRTIKMGRRAYKKKTYNGLGKLKVLHKQPNTKRALVRVVENEKEKPRDIDIIAGRGGESNMHVGNKDLWEVILKYRDEYVPIPSHNHAEKHRIATLIYNLMLDQGRRFVSRGQNLKLVETPEKKAVESIKQKLRDKFVPSLRDRQS